MAITRAHIEDSSLTQYIVPKGQFEIFESDEHYAEKWNEWNLGGKSPKKELWYKGNGYQRLVTILGYEVHGSYNTLVIEFQDGNLTCINPAYLKEMQSGNFGKESDAPEEATSEITPKPKEKKKPTIPSVKTQKIEKVQVKEQQEKKVEKIKITLTDEKVHFTAKVKQFTTKFNHFNDKDEEVVLYEEVRIMGLEEIELGEAWSSKSKSIEKVELAIGDKVEFDAKVVDNKKFNKDIIFKINNPSKFVKM
jgi:hypothetical protein